MKGKIKTLVIESDGTVVSPTTHDTILTKCTFFDDTLTLEFRLYDMEETSLYFKNIRDLNIHCPRDFLVFRLSAFDFHCPSEEYFYFKTALKTLNIKDGADYLRKKYSEDYRLFYFEGSIGGTISFVSNQVSFLSKLL